MSNLVPTPIVDKNGKQTTVLTNPDKSRSSASTARVAAIDGKKVPAEKRTAVKLPQYHTLHPLMESDVVEVGSTKTDYGSQKVYLNGVEIGSISSNEEQQHYKIKGTRLSRGGAARKVWRVSGDEPKLPGDLHTPRFSDDSFSRGGAAYSLAKNFRNNELKSKSVSDYIARGGFFLGRKQVGDESVWTVGGKSLPDDGGKFTIKVTRDPGYLTTGFSLIDSKRSWVALSVDLDSDRVDSGTAEGYVKTGYNEYFEFAVSENGEFSFVGDSRPAPEYREFCDEAVKYVKQIRNQHYSALSN